jgi:hypothetical protein
VLLALALAAGPAAAHTSERGFVMLLPTGLYILGGALAVGLSFVIMALVPSRAFTRLTRLRWPIAALREGPLLWPSALGLALFAALVYAGFTGTRDPLANPLPPVLWSLWWVGFTYAVAIFGDLWQVVNPWRALYRIATSVPPLAPWRERPPVAYPDWLGVWPAVFLLFAFAWFELIYPAPMDPGTLALACTGYALLMLGGMLVFGERAWLSNADAFSVYFRMVGWLSPLARDDDGSGRGRRLSVAIPCAGLFSAGTLGPGMVAFVLLALATVSFDGLALTFRWLTFVGENPLEFPGRTSLVAVNSLGLAATWLALAAAYAIAVRAGRAVATGTRAPAFARYVVAIVPIAFAYHFAHYLPFFLVDGQHALRALSDPFGLGWNLLGFRDWHVTASFLAQHHTVHAIWNLQVAAIVLGHVAAVCIAHAIALEEFGRPRAALLSQAPMTVLMVGYTVFGLWLLSTPVAG